MIDSAKSGQSIDWHVIPRHRMARGLYDEIVTFCSRAYEEELAPLMATHHGGTHVLGREGGRLVSHALWVTRRLQMGSSRLLRTAYIEAGATERDRRRRGYASQVMQRIAAEVRDFDIAALSPFDAAWYVRLGWESWRGPRFTRSNTNLIATPDEEVMILRLPRTPSLDLNAPLSAEWREGELW